MTMAAVDYLIVGGGIAGTTAAETLRQLCPDASITIISAELHPLYSRVLLPHLVAGKIGREKVFLRTAEKYAAKDIEVVYGARAVRLRPAERALETDGDREYRYGKLLLATGGEALSLAVPGADLRGVTSFRTLEDAELITALLGETQSRPTEERAGVAVGGSFIGLEFPPFFEKFGVSGGIVIRGERFWRRILDDQASGVIEDALTAHGIRIYKGGELAACEGEGRLRGVRLADGRRIKTSFLGYGLGLSGAPTFGLDARITGGPQGIETDEYLRTNAPDVWAAGDCACWRDVTAGRSHRLGNWLNAQEQGRYAAEAMAGAVSAPFAGLSAYATQIFDLSLAMIGDLTTQTESVWLTRGLRSSGKVARLHLRANQLVGAALVNVLSERGVITALIKNRVPVAGREKELNDPSFDLKNLL